MVWNLNLTLPLGFSLLCEQRLALPFGGSALGLDLKMALLLGARLHLALLLRLALLIGALLGIAQLLRLNLGAAILFRALLSGALLVELLRRQLRERAVEGSGQQHGSQKAVHWELTSSFTFTNWLGNRAPSLLSNVALSFMVPFVSSI